VGRKDAWVYWYHQQEFRPHPASSDRGWWRWRFHLLRLRRASSKNTSRGRLLAPRANITWVSDTPLRQLFRLDKDAVLNKAQSVEWSSVLPLVWQFCTSSDSLRLVKSYF